jgi:hypothetical protein
MKKYFVGLMMSGLASRISRNTSAVMPWRKKSSASETVTKLLVGAGIGVTVALVLGQKLKR